MNEETSNKIERKIDEMYRYMSSETRNHINTISNCVAAVCNPKNKRNKRIQKTLRKVCV